MSGVERQRRRAEAIVVILHLPARAVVVLDLDVVGGRAAGAAPAERDWVRPGSAARKESGWSSRYGRRVAGRDWIRAASVGVLAAALRDVAVREIGTRSGRWRGHHAAVISSADPDAFPDTIAFIARSSPQVTDQRARVVLGPLGDQAVPRNA